MKRRITFFMVGFILMFVFSELCFRFIWGIQ